MALNGLGGARSAYLRSAMAQPVAWMEWGAEAFARAAREDKPVLLDIGAVWCHWCHVMDRESYEDPETARIINEHFVAVKVDRDERPDVDARYQAAVAAISGQGGWPLTALLTPDGKPFFGGTYFPPVDGHGRPSLRRVLMTMAEAFEQRRGEVEETAGSVMAAIEQNEMFAGSGTDPGRQLLEKIVASALQQVDRRFGGFGSQPKFPHSGALDLLLDAAAREERRGKREEQTQSGGAALMTLEKMAGGGIYDHLAGGFHRYSVDERWVVPHFEKMLYDNAGLLRNYVHAFQSFAEPECARVAREIVAWVDRTMSDRERGGFYASQDADGPAGPAEKPAGPAEKPAGSAEREDDGDYFTWTLAEAAAVLTADEMRVVGPWFHIGEVGDMHHNPEKNCLHLEHTLAEVARGAGVSTEAAARLVRSGRAKLLAARNLRATPVVDETVYVGWNGMMVSAYLQAGRVLGDAEALAFGLKTLDRVLAETWDGESLGHVAAYGDEVSDAARTYVDPGVPGGLDDYGFTALASLDAWEATGEPRYFEAALALGEQMVRRFYDRENGGFFDTEPGAGEQFGALTARRKPLQDAPTPAGNAVAASVLLRLAELTGRDDLREQARATLACFAGVVEHFGLFAASYGLALRRLVEAPVQVVVVGADAAADQLERAALGGYAVSKSVVRLRGLEGELPAALAQTIPHLPAQAGSFAVVCRGFTCGLPVRSVEELVAALKFADAQIAPVR